MTISHEEYEHFSELMLSRNEVGTETLLKHLDGDKEQLPGDIINAINEFGADRVRQYLAVDGEPVCTLYRTYPVETLEVDIEPIIEYLHELWLKGKIARYNEQQLQVGSLQTEMSSQVVAAVKKWMKEHRASTETFENKFEIPDVILEGARPSGSAFYIPHIHETETSNHDKAGRIDIPKVFTDESGGAPVCGLSEFNEFVETPNHHLTCRLRTAASTELSRDTSGEGFMKEVLTQSTKAYLGDEWELWVDEMQLDPPSAQTPRRADLVFYHKDEPRNLIVEIKTSEDGVREAIGQVQEYRERFLEEFPEISSEAVELAIAAPSFSRDHRKVAEDTGIQLVEVPIIE